MFKPLLPLTWGYVPRRSEPRRFHGTKRLVAMLTAEVLGAHPGATGAEHLAYIGNEHIAAPRP